MAVKDSEELKANERYPLGDYNFRIERSSIPGSSNDKIEAICTDKDGKNARKSIQIPSSAQLVGWYVEANETEATVYIIVKKKEDSPIPVDVPYTILSGPIATGTYEHPTSNWTIIGEISSGVYVFETYDVPMKVIIVGSTLVAVFNGPNDPSSFFIGWRNKNGSGSGSSTGSVSYTYNGKTVYFGTRGVSNDQINKGLIPISTELTEYQYRDIAWAMEYGTAEETTEEILVARFAIDIEDAGGVGPGSDWVDPGDYDPDWEPDDPTHTLYVEVTGALSGRHNDPIVDPSYSYIPADKDTVKDYGCGGDGGNGGGGGAGASTVVIHKFATNQANSKEVTAIARRHGYGSGGGKGGKGGDGCILVYY